LDSLGTLKASRTRRDPHAGHFKRLSSLASGKVAPRVHTSVGKSSSAPYGWSWARLVNERFTASAGRPKSFITRRKPKNKFAIATTIEGAVLR